MKAITWEQKRQRQEPMRQQRVQQEPMRQQRVLEQVLRGISRRLTKPEELAAAMQELRVLYEPLSEDFRLFYPQLQDFAQSHPTT